MTSSVSRASGLALLTLAFATGLAVSGCGGGGGGSPANERVVQNFSSCDQKPDVGASALLGNASKTEWIEGYFDKPYDRYDLEAVLNASSTSTTEYVGSLGITLFKVPRADMKGLCPTYFNLAVAPPIYQSVWNQVSGGGTASDQGGKLAGLFFEFCGSGTGASCQERAMVQPTIMVDEASDRWTIVHEMMHFNFNQGRKANPDIPTTTDVEHQMRTAAAALKKALDSYNQLPDRGDLQMAADALRNLFVVGKQIGVRRDLEEMTIEATLVDRWVAGELKNVDGQHAPASGVWYMTYSMNSFLDTLSPLAPIVTKISKEADAHEWSEISSHVHDTNQMIDDTKTDLKRMIETAKHKIKAVQNSDDDSQFSRVPPHLRGTFKSGPLDVKLKTKAKFVESQKTPPKTSQEIAREAMHAHLESHDPDHLAATYKALLLGL